ncbi:MAG TPA: nitroreductase family protein [Methanomassiliicoccales archaeon]|nr:nitroreductase family protein [Methanomassiliicoccales archaeon]
MNTLEAIRTRRSVRSFAADPVPKEAIEEILRAAMSAPSAGNEQPWQFLVIDDRKKLDSITTANPNAKMCKEAQAAILVCGDTTKEKYPGFWVQDCAAATQNILLAAHAQGLGSVWTGVYPIMERVQGFKELMVLPGNIVPFSLVMLGYPSRVPAQVDRFQRDRVHNNSW